MLLFVTFPWICQGIFIVQLDHFIGFFHFGLACRPTDLRIAPLLFVCLEGHQSWPGGLVSLALWLGLFCFFLVLVQL